MNVIEHYFNKLSTHSRNKLVSLSWHEGGKVSLIIFRLCLPWQSIPSYKVLFKCFEFSSKRYDPDKVGFFISESVKHQFTVPNTKKQLTKISVLMPFLWKKFWVQGRVILWVIRNLELFDITANTVSICMILIWLKSKNQI